MNHHTREIRGLSSTINEEFARPSKSEGSKRAVQHYIRHLEAEYQIVRREDGYTQFVLNYVRRQQEAFRNGERDEPVCSCSNPECPLKRRRLPRPVRRAEEVDAGIRRFRNDHRGNPVVLAEAQEQFTEVAGMVEATLRSCLAILANDTYRETDPEAVVEGLDERPPGVATA